MTLQRLLTSLRRHRGLWACSVALFAGMLFWAKLRVIHDIPRSAYAVPDGETAQIDGDATSESCDSVSDADTQDEAESLGEHRTLGEVSPPDAD